MSITPLSKPDLSLPDDWPQALSTNVKTYYQQFTSVPDHADCRKHLANVCAASEFAAKVFLQQPTLLIDLFSKNDIKKRLTKKDYLSRVKIAVKTVSSNVDLMHQLRLFRQRELVRLIWREVTQLDSIQQTLSQLSAIADCCIEVGLDLLYQWHCQQYGTPYDKHGEPMPMIVLALGKLGGQELNLSSDIDLQFAYAHQGEIVHNEQTTTHEIFFMRLAQALINSLNTVNRHGFVYRVDMRLRPFGSSGRLVMSIPALSAYYQQHGRDWERYALVKARIIVGHGKHADALKNMLQHFVYRRYIDYSILDGLRTIKQQINHEARVQNLQQNIKLGQGGIREIEFIVQAFQIVHAAKKLQLQQPSLIEAMPLLAKSKLLPKSVVKQLWQAYQFLRRLENALQAVDDQQTHTLPNDPITQYRVCLYCGFSDWSQLLEKLRHHQQHVIKHFTQMISQQPQHFTDDKQKQLHYALQAIWLEHTEQTDTLSQLGFSDPEQVSRLLCEFKENYRYRKLSSLAYDRLNKFMPILLTKVANMDDPTQTLIRMLNLLKSIIQRSAYIVLLIENPCALSLLLELVSKSPWVAKQLANYPIVLDELLVQPVQRQVPTVPALCHLLHQQLQSQTDPEQQMEHLRDFKHTYSLRVAAAELLENLPLMRISDYLTNLATAIVHETVNLVTKQLVDRHGFPATNKEIGSQSNLLIIAYGKLGGIELSYTSDLDLVFLHADTETKQTTGDNPIDSHLFYTRLAQRLLHALSVRSHNGTLYAVDTRLRPAGEAGLLHSTLSAFADYQQNEAWTWEHQALVRARPIYGDPMLTQQFWNVRRNVLSQCRDPDILRHDIVTMRNKLMATATQDINFPLKHCIGGITDIEFLVQYGVLRWAYAYPELLTYTDNIRLLACLQNIGKLSQEMAYNLMRAYTTYRGLLHRHSLTQIAIDIDSDSLKKHLAVVNQQWQQWMG